MGRVQALGLIQRMTGRTFQKILIANRGEIALRIARTCRALGIPATMIYGDSDSRALHVRNSDEAVRIDSSRPYLDIERIIDAARRVGADAIHPGYGFLSEDYRFAEACRSAGFEFIGPPTEAIRQMGLKHLARGIAKNAGVPVTPGYDGDDQSDDVLSKAARNLGFPVMLKASAGGGGRGIRLVRAESELGDSIESARREALSSFGDARLLVEKVVEAARHIEVQVLGDSHGNLVHLFERDCSLQRRNQKVIEECPARGLDDRLRKRLFEAALSISNSIGYQNAGTIEFLLSADRDFYFLEMNTRLQVEHTVTEMVTGFDLVALQIRVAQGEPLPFSQDEIRSRGVAVEARLYAESPVRDFFPSTGRIQQYFPPETSDSLRIDSGVEARTGVGIDFDPMLAKVIAHAHSREQALRKLASALKEFVITGVETNRDFLIRLLNDHAVVDGEVTTNLISSRLKELSRPANNIERQTAAAVGASYLQRLWREKSDRFRRLPGSYRNNPYRPPSVSLTMDGEEISVEWESTDDRDFKMTIRDGNQEASLDVVVIEWRRNSIRLQIDSVQRRYRIHCDDENLDIVSSDAIWRLSRTPRFPDGDISSLDYAASAPMPGRVLKILVVEGQHVDAGDALIILEAMKMEQMIRSVRTGIVTRILVKAGDQVSPGDDLIQIEAEVSESGN